MDSFLRGFGFLKQSWQMALADRDLIKPSIYALFAGFLVTVIFSAPTVMVFVLFGESPWGQALGFVFGALLVFAQYVVSYLFSSMTIYLIYGYLAEGDGRMDRAWAIVRRDLLDILSLAAASTIVNLVKQFMQGNKKGRTSHVLAGILDTIWTQATYLVLPAMVIEDISLVDGLRRATHIARHNLLLIGISTVGVKAVTNLIGFLLGATGIGLGLGVGLGIINLTQAAPAGLVGGISLGVLIASFFILVATLVTAYTTTAYHTCLYLWARQVEAARQKGEPIQNITAPGPLAAVLQKVGVQNIAW